MSKENVNECLFPSIIIMQILVALQDKQYLVKRAPDELQTVKNQRRKQNVNMTFLFVSYSHVRKVTSDLCKVIVDVL